MKGMRVGGWIFLHCPLKLSGSFFFLIIRSDLGTGFSYMEEVEF